MQIEMLSTWDVGSAARALQKSFEQATAIIQSTIDEKV